MLKRNEILNLLKLLDRELIKINKETSIFICGGATMALVYNNRRTTEDIDGVFEDRELIYKLVDKIAEDEGLSKGWLNDSVKGILDTYYIDTNYFISGLTNLKIYYAKPEYMLALKCLACNRGKKRDIDDVKVLLEIVGIRDIEGLKDNINIYFDYTLVNEEVYRELGNYV